VKPYEAASARVRAMYRLLAPPSGGRTMEVCFGAPPILAASDWRGEHVGCILKGPGDGSTDDLVRLVDAQWQPAPGTDRPFDLIVLHRTLDRLASVHPAASDARALEVLFGALSERLVPGGILAVTVANGAWLSQIRGSWRERNAHRQQATARLSWRRLRRLFAATGFSQVRSYNVLPDADAPLRLVDNDADLSRLGFRRELASMRSSLPPASYLLRSIVAELALNRHFEGWVLASGVRP
jgi:hypothetical protein